MRLDRLAEYARVGAMTPEQCERYAHLLVVVEKNRPPELIATAPTPAAHGAAAGGGWGLDVTLRAPARVFLIER